MLTNNSVRGLYMPLHSSPPRPHCLTDSLPPFVSLRLPEERKDGAGLLQEHAAAGTRRFCLKVGPRVAFSMDRSTVVLYALLDVAGAAEKDTAAFRPFRRPSGLPRPCRIVLPRRGASGRAPSGRREGLVETLTRPLVLAFVSASPVIHLTTSEPCGGMWNNGTLRPCLGIV
jgi:hypothetical protein